MKLFDVPIWVIVSAESQDAAWRAVSDIVDMILSDAQEAGEIVQWKSGEPQEAEATV